MRAVKLRFHHADWREDVAVVEPVRDAVGDDFELMVDANQGWRMPGDRAPRWDVATAAACARELERLGVYWLEEPLRCDDVEGYARCGAAPGSASPRARWCAGCTRRATCCCAAASTCCSPTSCSPAASAAAAGSPRSPTSAAASFSPHTWSNGLGLLANLHLALAVSTCPYLEVPFDPPAWTPAQRDWLLPAPLEIAADGTIAPAGRPRPRRRARPRGARALAGP